MEHLAPLNIVCFDDLLFITSALTFNDILSATSSIVGKLRSSAFLRTKPRLYSVFLWDCVAADY